MSSLLDYLREHSEYENWSKKPKGNIVFKSIADDSFAINSTEIAELERNGQVRLLSGRIVLGRWCFETSWLGEGTNNIVNVQQKLDRYSQATQARIQRAFAVFASQRRTQNIASSVKYKLLCEWEAWTVDEVDRGVEVYIQMPDYGGQGAYSGRPKGERYCTGIIRRMAEEAEAYVEVSVTEATPAPTQVNTAVALEQRVAAEFEKREGHLLTVTEASELLTRIREELSIEPC